jgi:hypothetical protein
VQAAPEVHHGPSRATLRQFHSPLQAPWSPWSLVAPPTQRRRHKAPSRHHGLVAIHPAPAPQPGPSPGPGPGATTQTPQVNTSPALFRAGAYLADLLPRLVEEVVQKAVDPLFPPHPGTAAMTAKATAAGQVTQGEAVEVQGGGTTAVPSSPALQPLDGFVRVVLDERLWAAAAALMAEGGKAAAGAGRSTSPGPGPGPGTRRSAGAGLGLRSGSGARAAPLAAAAAAGSSRGVAASPVGRTAVGGGGRRPQ